MISFKQFLDEKAMNPGAFEKTALRQATKAKVGFEFELVVPYDSTLIGDGGDTRDFIRLDRIDSFDELFDYFSVPDGRPSRLVTEFENWGDEYKENWVEENHEVDNDLAEKEGTKYATSVAKDDAREVFEKDHADEISFNSYIDNEYGSMYLYIHDHDMEPKYGWNNDTGKDSSYVYVDGIDSEDIADILYPKLEDELSKYLGTTVTTPTSSASEHFTKGDWLVVPDASISSPNGIGVEIVSPPTPLQKALQDLKNMFKWMGENGIETNSSTGLHINVSLPGIDGIDLVKLVLFLGEKHVLKQFDRFNNMYTTAQTQTIMNNVAGKGELPKEAKEMIALARSAMSKAKYSSVHISKLSDGYLEFRIAGNENYHHNYQKIRETVLRFVSALEIAIDPESERKEYLKKLSKILDAGTSGDRNADFDTRPIADILDLAGEDGIAKILKQWMADAKAGKITSPSTIKRAENWVGYVLFQSIFNAFNELGITSPSARHRAELKMIMKAMKVTPEAARTPSSMNSWVRKQFGLEK